MIFPARPRFRGREGHLMHDGGGIAVIDNNESFFNKQSPTGNAPFGRPWILFSLIHAF